MGCKVNHYETEAMREAFVSRGAVSVGEDEAADVYIINTCTVTNIADRKSRQFIRRAKRVNPDALVAVTGCYVQVAADEVAEMPEVDLIVGNGRKSEICGLVMQKLQETSSSKRHADVIVLPREELTFYEDMGRIEAGSDGMTRAYIKIQDGCDRFCSYCLIPYARGPVRSRPAEDIVEEVRALVEAGHMEIILTGINTALYGKERGNLGIVPLLAKLEELPGDFRIRLSSLEPAVVNADYVRRLLKYDRLCHHLHLSAQSGSDRILKAMNRPYDRSQYLQIVEALRSFDPWYGISTDIIVGFPGEKERDFEDSLSLVQICDFCKVHAFKYSRRPKTLAASMKEQVSPQVKNRRSDQLQEAGAKAAAGFCEKNLGRQEIVLIEEYLPRDGMVTGFTGNYIRAYIRCPEEGAGELLNTFRQVRLTESFRDGCIALIL